MWRREGRGIYSKGDVVTLAAAFVTFCLISLWPLRTIAYFGFQPSSRIHALIPSFYKYKRLLFSPTMVVVSQAWLVLGYPPVQSRCFCPVQLVLLSLSTLNFQPLLSIIWDCHWALKLVSRFFSFITLFITFMLQSIYFYIAKHLFGYNTPHHSWEFGTINIC